MRINDAILGLIIIVGSVLVILEARSYPALPGIAYGPDFFPTVIAGAMILGGLILVFKGIGHLKQTGWYALDAWARKGSSYISLCLIFGSLVFYILLSERLGFIITSATILLVLLFWTRGRKHLASTVLISLIFPFAIFFLFSTLMRIPLPRGPLL